MLDPRDQVNLLNGVVIPACPLALTGGRRFDDRAQRALVRYYMAAGAGGLAVGVHTTQFAIRDPRFGLFEPVLTLAAEELKNHPGVLRIGGVCGPRPQALQEAALLRDLGYHAALLSLGALKEANTELLLEHCRAVAEIIPVIGFYLQPLAGGRLLPYSFWRRFAEIPNIAAIKIAPFNRYQTIDVVRAVSEAGRDDIALYTGNDDNIVADLLTPFRFNAGSRVVERRIVSGLLGQWAVWTRRAVELLHACHQAARSDLIPAELLALNAQLTDANAAIFDAANGFAGCIPGIHEILRRQGLLANTRCLDPSEALSPGQMAELDRITSAYPHLMDDEFVNSNRDKWYR